MLYKIVIKSKMSTKRIQRELLDIQTDPPEDCSAGITNDNLLQWTAIIFGPPDTPYQGGSFQVDIEFPENYPFKAPKIRFITPVYHPNINRDGGICLDILKDNWSPALSIAKVLISIRSLLADPNPDDPLVAEIAREYKNNYQLFYEKAVFWTNKYAF